MLPFYLIFIGGMVGISIWGILILFPLCNLSIAFLSNVRGQVTSSVLGGRQIKRREMAEERGFGWFVFANWQKRRVDLCWMLLPVLQPSP